MPRKEHAERRRSCSGSKRYQRHFIQHNYHDHSQDTPEKEYIGVANITTGGSNLTLGELLGTKTQGNHCGAARRFPLKLQELLDSSEENGIADIISWKIHGRAFSIHKAQDFAEKIMPLHFHQTKITSFYRQLNLYGFLRITQGHDKGAYYHELFLRRKPFLANRMKRLKVKGTKIKGLPSPETEPDFYAMPYVIATSTPTEALPALPKCPEDLDCSIVSKNPSPPLARSSSITFSNADTCSENCTSEEKMSCPLTKVKDENTLHNRGLPCMFLHGNSLNGAMVSLCSLREEQEKISVQYPKEPLLLPNAMHQKKRLEKQDLNENSLRGENILGVVKFETLTSHHTDACFNDNFLLSDSIEDDKEIFDFLQDLMEPDYMPKALIDNFVFDRCDQDDIFLNGRTVYH